MSAPATLTAVKRDKLGSRNARMLRSEGRIICSLQGDKEHEHLDFHISEPDFLTSRRAHTHLYDIQMDGQNQAAIVESLQWDALGSRLMHVEFRPVTLGVATEVEVELNFFGTPADGILTHNVNQIKIVCLPTQIPDSIEVNVEGMQLGEHIAAKDLKLPEGVTLSEEDADTEIAVVTEIKEVAEAPAEGEEGDEAADAAPAAGAEGAGDSDK